MTVQNLRKAIDFVGNLNPLYAVLLLLGGLGAITAHFVNRKKYEKFWAVTLVYAIGLILAFFLTYALTAFFNTRIAEKYQEYYLTEFSFLYTTAFFLFTVGIFSLILGWDFKKIKEPFAASILVFLFFSKIGCFFNGCCASKPIGARGTILPLNLFESGFALLLATLYFWKKMRVFYPFLLIYLPYRFFSEFIRATYACQKIFMGILTGAQIVSAILFVVLILGIVLWRIRRKRKNEADVTAP